MARCPFATWRPISKARSKITPRAIIAHTAVSGASSLFGYFSGVGDDSHFYIDGSGRIEQYVDTGLSAYANRDANSFAISIETWDNRDPEHTPWTSQQVAAILRLNDWLADTHDTISRQQIAAPFGSGLGWHAMFGAPSAWTSKAGKTCPGAPRIAQMKSIIIPAFVKNVVPGQETGTTNPEEDEEMSSDSGPATTGDEWGVLHVPVNGHRYLRIATSFGHTAKLGGITLVDDTPPAGDAARSHVWTVQNGGVAEPDRPGPWDLAKTVAGYANTSHLAIPYQCAGPIKAWTNDRG